MIGQATHATEITELVDSLRTLRLKCKGLQHELPAYRSRLSKYDQLEVAILDRIKNLDEQSYMECKASLSRAIEELLEINTHLSRIKVHKDGQMDFTPRSPKPRENGRVDWPEGRLSSPKLDGFVQSPLPVQINNDFRHNELIQLWKPHRHSDDASDAVDRLNKLRFSEVGKVKGLLRDEQAETPKLSVFELPEFCVVLEELERYKMLAEQLMQKNEALRDELLKVRAEIFLSKYRPRYYRPEFKQFGCGTETPVIMDKAFRLPKEQPTDRWSDEVEIIKNELQESFRKVDNVLEMSKDSLSETLLLDMEESMSQSKLTYSGSEKSLKIVQAPDPNVCKELVINEQRLQQLPPRTIVKLGTKR